MSNKVIKEIKIDGNINMAYLISSLLNIINKYEKIKIIIEKDY
jgi:hypothetical protein